METATHSQRQIQIRTSSPFLHKREGQGQGGKRIVPNRKRGEKAGCPNIKLVGSVSENRKRQREHTDAKICLSKKSVELEDDWGETMINRPDQFTLKWWESRREGHRRCEMGVGRPGSVRKKSHGLRHPALVVTWSVIHTISQGYYYHTTVADQRVSQLNLSSPRNIPIRSGYQVAQRRTTAIFAWKFFKN